eukprot:Cvel_28741.t1-p1 / transcript=Cvel_28741.t1 / gene=Cvel_28741 / organism=Chromera_velia_CCMP2878 / gene_product=Leucine-rich repeat-containing protein 9, putative / transcript_product=Leucine-rich repeat-containing protein 9, putative / location=Cvel_scaffold3821:7278-13633(+) / protein_length=1172 / sequence_SO=supercontig / SO=protein_coding / is_pseudo=false
MKFSQALGRSVASSTDRVALSGQNIHEIDVLSPEALANVARCTRLQLTSNALSSLSGIDQFPRLEKLAIGYNRLSDIAELLKIPLAVRERLTYLSVEGNPFCRRTDAKSLLFFLFPRLEALDGAAITEAEREDQLVSCSLCPLLVPLVLLLRRREAALGKAVLRAMLKFELQWRLFGNSGIFRAYATGRQGLDVPQWDVEQRRMSRLLFFRGGCVSNRPGDPFVEDFEASLTEGERAHSSTRQAGSSPGSRDRGGTRRQLHGGSGRLAALAQYASCLIEEVLDSCRGLEELQDFSSGGQWGSSGGAGGGLDVEGGGRTGPLGSCTPSAIPLGELEEAREALESALRKELRGIGGSWGEETHPQSGGGPECVYSEGGRGSVLSLAVHQGRHSELNTGGIQSQKSRGEFGSLCFPLVRLCGGAFAFWSREAERVRECEESLGLPRGSLWQPAVDIGTWSVPFACKEAIGALWRVVRDMAGRVRDLEDERRALLRVDIRQFVCSAAAPSSFPARLTFFASSPPQGGPFQRQGQGGVNRDVSSVQTHPSPVPSFRYRDEKRGGASSKSLTRRSERETEKGRPRVRQQQSAKRPVPKQRQRPQSQQSHSQPPHFFSRLRYPTHTHGASKDLPSVSVSPLRPQVNASSPAPQNREAMRIRVTPPPTANFGRPGPASFTAVQRPHPSRTSAKSFPRRPPSANVGTWQRGAASRPSPPVRPLTANSNSKEAASVPRPSVQTVSAPRASIEVKINYPDFIQRRRSAEAHRTRAIAGNGGPAPESLFVPSPRNVPYPDGRLRVHSRRPEGVSGRGASEWAGTRYMPLGREEVSEPPCGMGGPLADTRVEEEEGGMGGDVVKEGGDCEGPDPPHSKNWSSCTRLSGPVVRTLFLATSRLQAHVREMKEKRRRQRNTNCTVDELFHSLPVPLSSLSSETRAPFESRYSSRKTESRQIEPKTSVVVPPSPSPHSLHVCAAVSTHLRVQEEEAPPGPSVSASMPAAVWNHPPPQRTDPSSVKAAALTAAVPPAASEESPNPPRFCPAGQREPPPNAPPLPPRTLKVVFPFRDRTPCPKSPEPPRQELLSTGRGRGNPPAPSPPRVRPHERKETFSLRNGPLPLRQSEDLMAEHTNVSPKHPKPLPTENFPQEPPPSSSSAHHVPKTRSEALEGIQANVTFSPDGWR